jgi:hypothetical protein
VIPFWAGTNQPKSFRQFTSIAEWTTELSADSPSSTALLQHPVTHLEGWTVSDVLIMTTREFGDPVADVIDVKACDQTLHTPSSDSDSVGIVLFYTRESDQSTHPLRLTRFRPRLAPSVIRPATTCFVISLRLTNQ